MQITFLQLTKSNTFFLVVLFNIVLLTCCSPDKECIKSALYDPALDPCNKPLESSGELGISAEQFIFRLDEMEDGANTYNVISTDFALSPYAALDSCINIYRVKVKAYFDDSGSPPERIRITSPTCVVETAENEFVYDPTDPKDYNSMDVGFEINGQLAWILNGIWQIEILEGHATSVVVYIRYKILVPTSPLDPD